MNYGFETRCIHGNGTDEKTHSYGSVAVPIYQAATFAHPGIGQSTGYDYTRESNPTRTELEHTMSALEGAVDTVACANGMAAVGLCLELFDRGDHILCTDDLYGGSVRMFESVGGKRGLEFSYVDTADADLVEAGIRENTKALYIETPSNPTMRVTDLRKMKEIADKHNLKIIVDNTFLSPLFQRPIELGADLVIQSFHKTLPAMTQTAVLHNCSERVDSRLIRRFMGIYQSSSPSYILMASIDACMDKMVTDGKEMFREFTRILEKARRRLSECKYIRLVSPEIGSAGVFDYDRSKLIFSTRYTSMTGTELAQLLLEKYHIQVEMQTEHYVLALAAVGDSEEGFERLCRAIEEIDQEESQKKRKTEGQIAERVAYTSMNQLMSVTEAMEAESEVCRLEESVGRISAEFGYLYPPGIPLIVPGEQITGQFIRNMRIYMEEGLYLQGLEDYTNHTIRVISQNTTKEQPS